MRDEPMVEYEDLEHLWSADEATRDAQQDWVLFHAARHLITDLLEIKVGLPRVGYGLRQPKVTFSWDLDYINDELLQKIIWLKMLNESVEDGDPSYELDIRLDEWDALKNETVKLEKPRLELSVWFSDNDWIEMLDHGGIFTTTDDKFHDIVTGDEDE